jgi:NADH:ubiquinone oxidoreductase subunit E
MGILQETQEKYGYLPLELQSTIADELQIPLTEVYGVATFYSQFTLKPKGKYKIGVCLGTACYVRGSQDILDKVNDQLGIATGETTEDGKFSVDATRCVGACGLAPVMMINEEVFGRLVPGDVADILAKY